LARARVELGHPVQHYEEDEQNVLPPPTKSNPYFFLFNSRLENGSLLSQLWQMAICLSRLQQLTVLVPLGPLTALEFGAVE
jgi:hypothetical protein